MRRLLAVLALALAPACAINRPPADPGQPPVTTEQKCSALKLAADAACTQPESQVCQASALLYSASGCGVFEIPQPPAEPDPCAGKAPSCDAQSDVDCWAENKDGVCQYWPAPVVVDPTPAPPAGVLHGRPGPIVPGYENTLGAEVNRALIAVHPEHCAAGRCVVRMDRQTFQAAVEEQLRKQGVWSGQHEKTTDEIAAARQPKDPWQGFHVYASTPDPNVGTMFFSTCPSTGPCLERPGSSYRGAYASPWADTPSQPPPPVVDDYGCPAPRPDRVWTAATLPAGWGADQIGQPRWKLNSKPHGGWIDTTAVTNRNEPYCRAIGMSPMADGTPRGECPMRAERTDGNNAERIACERYIAEGDWVVVGDSCESREGNSAQFRRTGAGSCRLCNPAKTVCTVAY